MEWLFGRPLNRRIQRLKCEIYKYVLEVSRMECLIGRCRRCFGRGNRNDAQQPRQSENPEAALRCALVQVTRVEQQELQAVEWGSAHDSEEVYHSPATSIADLSALLEQCPVRSAAASKTTLAASPAPGTLPLESLRDPYLDAWIAHYGCSNVSGKTCSDAHHHHLFYISRNSNYNCVVYEASADAFGQLADASNAVSAYWFDIDPAYVKKHKASVLNKCCRVELNYMDRTLAYGATSKSLNGGGIEVTLVAMKKRRIVLVQHGAETKSWRAQTEVSGKRCFMLKLYVCTEMSWKGPSVKYVLLWGEDCETGELVQETVVP